jgi:hypothetical protein
MDYTKLNKILRDLPALRRGNLLTKHVIKAIDPDGEQGEDGISYEVYQISGTDIFVKLEIHTDSYGDNEHVFGIQFVQPVEKKITDYIAI